MADANIDVVRRLFEDYAAGGVEAVIEEADENVVIEIPPELSAEPDTYRGHDGVRRYFAGFEGTIDDVRYEPLELTERGPFVIAQIRVSGRGVSSGLDVDLEVFVVNELANGRIVRIRPYADLEAAQAAIA